MKVVVRSAMVWAIVCFTHVLAGAEYWQLVGQPEFETDFNGVKALKEGESTERDYSEGHLKSTLLLRTATSAEIVVTQTPRYGVHRMSISWTAPPVTIRHDEVLPVEVTWQTAQKWNRFCPQMLAFAHLDSSEPSEWYVNDLGYGELARPEQQASANRKNNILKVSLKERGEELKFYWHVACGDVYVRVWWKYKRIDGEAPTAGNTATPREKGIALRNQAAELEQKQDWTGAIGKWRESLTYIPDPRVEERIGLLQKRANATPPGPNAPAPAPKPGVTDVAVARGMTVQVGRSEVPPQGRAIVPVSLIQGRDLASLNWTVRYDTSVVKLVGPVAQGALLNGILFQANSREAGVVRLGFAGKTGISGDGELARLSFEAIGGEGQRSPLRVEIVNANAGTGGPVTVGAMDGEIVIRAPGGAGPGPRTDTGSNVGTGRPDAGDPADGDGDGDGQVTALDALMALKISVGLLPFNAKLDLDKDRSVTANDARLILVRVVSK